MPVPKDVTVKLSFLDWQDLYEREKPYEIFIDIPESYPDLKQTNCVFKEVEHVIHDVRGSETKFTLDEHGFMFRKHNTALRNDDLRESSTIEEQYLPEAEAFIRSEIDEVDRIFIFDWRLRRYRSQLEEGPLDLNDLTTFLKPAVEIHVDQSPAAVIKRVQLQLPEDADFLLQGRVRILNIWRPLVNAVEDWPLAVCDGRTARARDMIETDNIRKHYSGSTMYMMSDEAQRWYYMSKQSMQDVLVFKTFDSDSQARSKAVPHGSFQLPNVKPDVVPRTSIEVRALVFTYP